MKLSNEQLQQLKEETKKSLVEAQKAWIYRLIDFAKKNDSDLYISLNEAVSIGVTVPYTWCNLYSEVIEQLDKDGYKVLGNPETDNPYDVVVRKEKAL